MRIILTGGGTGGHTFPLIAVSRELKNQFSSTPPAPKTQQGLELIFIGPGKYAKNYILTEGIAFKNLLAGKWRRYVTPLDILRNFLDLFKTLLGFLQAYWYFLLYMPDAVFSKGGYGSFAVVIVAWVFRIPVILHESDSVPGFVNKFLSKFSKKIIVSFPTEYPQFPKNKTVLAGNPVRNLAAVDIAQARATFQITTNKPVIFIYGGSQGAAQINALVLAILKQLTANYEIIHQTGDQNYQKIIEHIETTPDFNQASYHPIAFLQEPQVEAAYTLSSLVVARAGSGNIFEMALYGKPSILIPLETSAAGHQQKNADIYEAAGACLNLSPQNLTPNMLLAQIDILLSNAEQLAVMSENAKKFAKPNAAKEIAQIILQYA